MYQYIYDTFLTETKYGKLLSVIENRLTDLGLQGRVEKLNLFKDAGELVEAGVKRGVKTVVAVGDDATLSQVVNAAAKFDVTVGFIPFGPRNAIAKVLGIGEGEEACGCLSNRLVQKIDVGKINDYYFLSHVQASSGEVNLKYAGNCWIKPVGGSRVAIYNLPTLKIKADPRDGYLEARVGSCGGNFAERGAKFGRFWAKPAQRGEESFFPVKKVILESRREASVLVDGLKTMNTPAEIRILSQRLKIIVGKNRLF